MHYLKKRKILPFFLTQFCGTFNDNAYKLIMLTLISYQSSVSLNQSQKYQTLASILFTLPFFIFSALAGQLADKFDKTRIIICIKALEVILMIFGGLGCYLNNVFFMMLVLMGLGIHSTFFSAITYSLLPQLLRKQELLSATAFMQAATFLAILLGTLLGPILISSYTSGVIYALAIINLVAWIGLCSSIFIPKPQAKLKNLTIDWLFWRATWHIMQKIMHNARVIMIVLMISWFWLIGVVILTKLPDYVHYILMANASVFAFFLFISAMGIAVGTIVISYWLKNTITLRLVPLSMLLFSLFAADIYFISPATTPNITKLQSLPVFLAQISNIRISLDFFLCSWSIGLFIVPLYTNLQSTSQEKWRARIMAANNLCNACFMVIGAGLVTLLFYLQITIPMVFLLLSISNVLMAFYLNLHLTKK